MRAPLFLCPLKRVVRATSPASLSFAPASPTPLRGLRPTVTGPVVRCALLRASGVAGHDPGPGLAPGPRPCRARHRPPRRDLGSSPPLGRSASQRLRRKRLRRSGFAAFWTPRLRGPVCTGDAGFSERDRRRSARCLCQSALLLLWDSAQSAAADRRFRRHSANLLPRTGAVGRLRPASLRPARPAVG